MPLTRHRDIDPLMVKPLQREPVAGVTKVIVRFPDGTSQIWGVRDSDRRAVASVREVVGRDCLIEVTDEPFMASDVRHLAFADGAPRRVR